MVKLTQVSIFDQFDIVIYKFVKEFGGEIEKITTKMILKFNKA